MKSSFIVIILILLLYLAGNVYIFYKIEQGIPGNNMLVRAGVVVLALFLVSAMLLSFVFADRLSVSVNSFLYRVGTSWHFIFLYLIVMLFLRELLMWGDQRWHFIPLRFSAHPGFPLLTIWISVGLAAIILTGGYLNYRSKKRVELTIETGKNMGNPVRILAMSDMHLGYAIGKKELQGWVKMINAEKPDIILIAGDIIDNSVRPLEEAAMEQELKKLNAPLGVYACPGNHEYISRIERSRAFLEASNINVLQDSSVLIDNRFYVVGRDDRSNLRRLSLQGLLSGHKAEMPVVLLDHQPMHLEEAVQQKVDLQLSGHTHRGQVWPVNWITDLMYEVSYGYKRKGDTHFYVTSGLGLWGGKFRIGSRSEYVVIELR